MDNTIPNENTPTSAKFSYGKRNWKKWLLISAAIAVVLAILISVIGFIFGIYVGDSYLDGVVVDQDTKAPVSDVKVVVSNRGWGTIDGQLVWDKDYVYSAITDQQGAFHIVYRVGPSAHVIITKDGYAQYDNYLDRNTKVTIELKRNNQMQVQDETANWKTYTNTDLEVSFKYPTNWTLTENFLIGIDTDPSGKKINRYSKTPVSIAIVPQDHKSGSVIDLLLTENPKNLSLKDLDKELTGPSGMGPQLYSSSAKSISLATGITAYYQKCTIDGGGPPEITGCDMYVIPYKQNVFQLRNVLNAGIPDQQKVFNQIVSSFKFLD